MGVNHEALRSWLGPLHPPPAGFSGVLAPLRSLLQTLWRVNHNDTLIEMSRKCNILWKSVILTALKRGAVTPWYAFSKLISQEVGELLYFLGIGSTNEATFAKDLLWTRQIAQPPNLPGYWIRDEWTADLLNQCACSTIWVASSFGPVWLGKPTYFL